MKLSKYKRDWGFLYWVELGRSGRGNGFCFLFSVIEDYGVMIINMVV